MPTGYLHGAAPGRQSLRSTGAIRHQRIVAFTEGVLAFLKTHERITFFSSIEAAGHSQIALHAAGGKVPVGDAGAQFQIYKGLNLESALYLATLTGSVIHVDTDAHWEQLLWMRNPLVRRPSRSGHLYDKLWPKSRFRWTLICAGSPNG